MGKFIRKSLVIASVTLILYSCVESNNILNKTWGICSYKVDSYPSVYPRNNDVIINILYNQYVNWKFEKNNKLKVMNSKDSLLFDFKLASDSLYVYKSNILEFKGSLDLTLDTLNINIKSNNLAKVNIKLTMKQ